MLSKIEGGLQELEETRYWFELLEHTGIVAPERLLDISNEARELTAILVTSARRLKILKSSKP